MLTELSRLPKKIINNKNANNNIEIKVQKTKKNPKAHIMTTISSSVILLFCEAVSVAPNFEYAV
jgi:hypothetical protein